MIYTNDITLSCQDLNIDLYADDSTLYESDFQISEIQTKLQMNLDLINKWCIINNMSLHPLKTKCMVIGSNYKLKHAGNLHLTINDCILENVTTQKNIRCLCRQCSELA